jgi:uncharacterized protein (DUF924 family)/uncharacterized membrane protein YphA (DoxX/SURF4 family)
MAMRIGIYWVVTGLLAAGMTFGGVSDLARSQEVVEVMQRLHYPPYFALILGVWKLAGALAIVAPGLPRVKEWAYAGIAFDLSGAAASHLAADDARHAILPLLFLALAVASWALRPASRRLGTLAGNAQLAMLLLALGGCTSEPQAAPLEVVEFWRGAGPRMWFAKDDDFDRRFRERFLALHEAAVRGELDTWRESPDGVLALCVLLDQFPRNAFRDTPRMYASDAQAREIADRAVRSGLAQRVDKELRLFVYLPFGHSEQLEDQERSVQLAQELGEPSVSHARQHRDIVKRFGRFPHRNTILGRAMRPEEQKYLDEGGFEG